MPPLLSSTLYTHPPFSINLASSGIYFGFERGEGFGWFGFKGVDNYAYRSIITLT
jgi:hypothetical protein